MALTVNLDLTVLPGNAPSLLLSGPGPSTPVFIAVALSFSTLFFFAFTFTTFRHKMGEGASAALEKPLVQRASAWIGVLGFMIGMYISHRWSEYTSSPIQDSQRLRLCECGLARRSKISTISLYPKAIMDPTSLRTWAMALQVSLFFLILVAILTWLQWYGWHMRSTQFPSSSRLRS